MNCPACKPFTSKGGTEAIELCRLHEREHRLEQLRAEIDNLRAQIDEEYWRFTRCARGKPPVLTRPDLYRRRTAAAAELAILEAQPLKETRLETTP